MHVREKMSHRKIKILLWLTILAVILACVPTFSAAPPIPTLDPGAINTFIVQTANAASTQTVVAMPTSTPAETFTPIPKNTDTPEPTATNTVVFILSTPTPAVISTFTGISNTTSNKNYACIPVSVSPASGTSFDPRTGFEAMWRVRNSGKKEWDRKIVHYTYNSGDKFHIVSSYDLSKSVSVGHSTELTVEMQSPKNPGIYTTNWALTVGSEKFCNLSLTIVVKQSSS